MKNTFYRPKGVNINEFESIVNKMRKDLSELVSGNVSHNDTLEYAKKLIDDSRPLSHNPGMVFWGLDEPENMPSDARVDFFYTPTYIAVSILVNTLLKNPKEAIQLKGFKDTLQKGLFASTGRDFMGHGYDSLYGWLDCMDIFATAHVFDFIRVYPDICPEFTSKLEEAAGHMDRELAKGAITGFWGEDYTEKANSIAPKIKNNSIKKKIFVYGTLLRRNANHNNYLGTSKFLGEAVLHGYSLYNLGSFPGIKPNDADSVKGELFEVDDKTLKRLNLLEGEGSLYSLKNESVEVDGSMVTDVGVYVYMHEVNEQNYVSLNAQPWRR